MLLVHLAPPPPGVFEMRESIVEAVQEWARYRGYAVVIRSSDNGRVALTCDRGGVYRKRRNLTAEIRRRNTASRKCDSLFKLLGSHDQLSDRWSLSVANGQHNHDPSTSSSAHPSLRKLTVQQREGLAILTASDVLPRTIGAIMQQTGAGDTLIMKDIYNARQRF
jgi:malonate-semialdehyde dehydrogenase (acetylating)/methylmalonate-semialdehyde dehydrogenase